MELSDCIVSSRQVTVNRDQYLSDRSVKGFIEWMKPMLCSQGSFRHSYCVPGKGVVTFSSIYDAFTQYEWGNADFNQTSKMLDCFAARLNAAADTNNPAAFRSTCEDILRWGGVLPRNQRRLEALGPGIVMAFKRAAAQLDPESADCRHLGNLQVPVARGQRPAYLMNAGFTKIYSLMIPGFPMYDGRVGAALGLLSRSFCEASKPPLRSVPANLAFPRGQGQSRIRDASRGTLRYVSFNGRPLLQAEWNLKAAWLLGELCQHGCFGQLRKNQRLRALEAALFMIGYDVS